MSDPTQEKIAREAARAQIKSAEALVTAIQAMTKAMGGSDGAASGTRNGGISISVEGKPAPLPIFGKDYFKPDEMNSLKKEILAASTPKYGKDYMTEEDIARFLKAITPKKGTDYSDGEPGKAGKNMTWADVPTSVKEKLHGAPGEPGKTPKHEWQGTSLRFEHAPGIWGAWHDLKGPKGDGFDQNSLKGRFQQMDEFMARSRTGALNLVELRDLPPLVGHGGQFLKLNADEKTFAWATPSGSGGGVNVATEKVTATQSGNNVTINLLSLAHTLIGLLFVTRQGQIKTPLDTTYGYTVSGNTVTVYNADASEDFLISYTY